jgi:hypothetical protein
MSTPPVDFSLSFIGLPMFCELSYFWNALAGRLVYSKREGSTEESREARPTAADWEALETILEKLRAWSWDASYINRAILDGQHWSLRIHWGDKRLSCSGANAYPPGFAVLRAAMTSLMEGNLSLLASSLLSSAETAAHAYAGPEAALAELLRKLETADDWMWNDEERQALADVVEKLGLAALPAIPGLLAAASGKLRWTAQSFVRDSLDHIRRAAEKADKAEVRRLGRPVLPVILAVVRDPNADHEIRGTLLQIVRVIAPNEDDTARAMVACLSSSDTHLFNSAFYTLEASEARPPEAIPVLLQALRERIASGQWAYSEQIVRALRRLFGVEAALQALPIVVETLRTGRPQERAVAMANLVEFGMAAREALPLVLDALHDPLNTVRMFAVEAVGAIGAGAPEVIPALMGRLADPSYAVRFRVPRALARLGPVPAHVVADLVSALRDESESVRKEAAMALAQLGPAHPESGDVQSMLEFLVPHAQERILRLFLVACARSSPFLERNPRLRDALAVAERFADGQASGEELSGAHDAVGEALITAHGGPVELEALALLATSSILERARVSGIMAKLADSTRVRWLAYDMLFAYSFQPYLHVSPAWLQWNNGTVRALAQTIYDQSRFEDMPILADALTEAGCNNEEMLHHCRTVPVHARGCRVLDALLRKEG